MNVVSLIDRAPRGLASRLGSRSRTARVLRPALNRILPRADAEVTVRSGIARGLRIVIEPRREKFYWSGAFEEAVQGALADELGPGQTFWDVGAHAGFFSLAAARLVGPSGRVVSFEPAPANRARLERAIESNGFGNIEVEPRALAGADEDGFLHAHGSTSMWTLVPALGGAGGVAVTCATIDTLASELGAPDLIKLDVEGAELDVLAGGVRLLESRRTKVILELPGNEAPTELRALLPSYTARPLGSRHWLVEAIR